MGVSCQDEVAAEFAQLLAQGQAHANRYESYN